MCGNSSDCVRDISVSIYTSKSKPEKREADSFEEGPEAHVLPPIGHEVLSSDQYVTYRSSLPRIAENIDSLLLVGWLPPIFRILACSER